MNKLTLYINVIYNEVLCEIFIKERLCMNTLKQEWLGNIKGDVLAGIVVFMALIPEVIIDLYSTAGPMAPPCRRAKTVLS